MICFYYQLWRNAQELYSVEAAMYGLPAFTHNTGGVMSYVEDGVTGRGLQLGSTGEDFANAILDMLNKKSI